MTQGVPQLPSKGQAMQDLSGAIYLFGGLAFGFGLKYLANRFFKTPEQVQPNIWTARQNQLQPPHRVALLITIAIAVPYAGLMAWSVFGNHQLPKWSAYFGLYPIVGALILRKKGCVELLTPFMQDDNWIYAAFMFLAWPYVFYQMRAGRWTKPDQ